MTMFSWPAYPRSDQELAALMVAIDGALSQQGLHPWQRPMHISRKLAEAFGWTGNIFPPEELALEPGYEGQVLMAKAHDWYERTYGDRLKANWAYGYAPVRLGNALWRVSAGVSFGTVRLFINRNLENHGVMIGGLLRPASCNVLCEVEGMPQGLANILTDDALRAHLRFHVFMLEALRWRGTLPKSELFLMARADYDESTASVLGARNNQARWASQQAVEKTIKGLLKIGGNPYPTGGPNAHNLDHVAKLLKEHHGIGIRPDVLDAAACPPKVRYGGVQISDEEALLANHAVLGVLDQLRLDPRAAVLLKNSATPPKGPR